MPPTNNATRPLRELMAIGFNNVFLSMERLAGGLITALMALFCLSVLAAVLLASPLGVGLLLLPVALRLISKVADRERHRLSRWGTSVPSPAAFDHPSGPGEALRALVSRPRVRRELLWLFCHATLGLLTGFLGVVLPIIAVRDSTFPLWWRLLPPETAGASIGVPVHTWSEALAVGLLGAGWGAVTFGVLPLLALLQSCPGRCFLRPRIQAVLAERITVLTETRAAALRSHTAELRRIERSLHDGAQNRLVAAIIRTGAARRALWTDPERAEEAMEQAQAAAEEALAELRGVVRSILPPALENNDLEGALTALAPGCSVPCTVDVGDCGPMASSIEATVYFAVAEAVTNITRHSGADRARIRVARDGDRLHARVHDNGRGGADERAGSGLAGVRRRVEAHDGTLTVDSPVGGPTEIGLELPCGS
ncbi:histidine kinase [Nocardiopsis kunsanensis]|uniref:histidine kinase n=1 Tax=Nocardiopsis kunsanensis TaxID=141693 RepID=A0A919CLF8_9ACTN|nr:sensor histidine kinase [Nocardiopsis kunsanensis]GHD36684.1 histidine kinase [Nocardiopsis kunsanensis]